MHRFLAVLLCALLCAGCTKAPQSSHSSSQNSSSVTPEPSQEPTPEPSPEPEDNTGDSNDYAVPHDNSSLAAFLERIDTEVHPGVMGAQIGAISCAAEMMDWYLEEKPDEDALRSAVAEHLKNEDNIKAFRMSLEIVSYAAEDIAAGDVTEGQLQDAGYTKPITWTKEDAQKLFSVLLDAARE